jgi:hypothetical protein
MRQTIHFVMCVAALAIGVFRRRNSLHSAAALLKEILCLLPCMKPTSTHNDVTTIG